jgi:hypothetical protein
MDVNTGWGVKYTLAPDGRTPVPVPHDSVLKWAHWMERFSHRKVALTLLPDGTRISTVFLGIDHNYRATGAPVLWETMVFPPAGEGDAAYDTMMDRYTSYDDAWLGHWHYVKLALVRRYTNDQTRDRIWKAIEHERDVEGQHRPAATDQPAPESAQSVMQE